MASGFDLSTALIPFLALHIGQMFSRAAAQSKHLFLGDGVLVWLEEHPCHLVVRAALGVDT